MQKWKNKQISREEKTYMLAQMIERVGFARERDEKKTGKCDITEIENAAEEQDIKEIDISSIRCNPYQPRQEIEKTALEELAMSIKRYGLMQPISVRQINSGEYELIAGERRLRACRDIGLEKIYARIMRVSGTDSAVLALIENIQRENLGYMEEAEAFSTLISEHGLTQEELAERLGKNQSTIANKIRILKLSPEIRTILTENKLTERHARALLKLPTEKLKRKALSSIISRGLNVSKTDELIDEMLTCEDEDNNKQKKSAREIRIFKDIRIFTNTIKQAVDMMQKSGIAAKSQKNETEEYIEYTIKIPKKAEPLPTPLK